MAILDGQVEVTTISRGPSIAIIEIQLEAIAITDGNHCRGTCPPSLEVVLTAS